MPYIQIVKRPQSWMDFVNLKLIWLWKALLLRYIFTVVDHDIRLTFLYSLFCWHAQNLWPGTSEAAVENESL